MKYRVKKLISCRIDARLIEDISKEVILNRKNFKIPNTITSIIERALLIYITHREGNKQTNKQTNKSFLIKEDLTREQ